MSLYTRQRPLEVEYMEPFSTDHPLYPKVLELRQNVLRKPLGLNLFDEDLSKEKGQLIFVAMYGDQVIACLMILPLNETHVKLRQMAVHEDF